MKVIWILHGSNGKIFSELFLGKICNFREKDKLFIFNLESNVHLINAHNIPRRPDVFNFVQKTIYWELVMDYRLAVQSALIENVLCLDGLSRAGKFLLGKIVSNFQKVEYFQSIEIIEYIPILNHLGCLDRNDAIALLRLNTNLNVYNRSVGRNLNLRKSDGSSVRNATNYNDYLQRTDAPDGIEAVTKLKIDKKIPSFLTHECLPHIELFFDTFPDLLMINIQRHPVDIAHSWFVRGWGERFGTDPLAFIPVIQGKRIPVPWFTKSWIDEYEKMSPVERVIKSICYLANLDKKTYAATNRKEQILLVSYEILFSEPENVISQIGEFLSSEPFPNMNNLLKREGCPRDLPLIERKNKLLELSNLTNSKTIINELVASGIEYEKKWGIDSFLY